MLVMTRKFVRNESNNLISFDYKVDGAACRKGSSGSCSHGLYVFVNGKQYLKKDTQFHWKKMEIPNLKPVCFVVFNSFIFCYLCVPNFVLLEGISRSIFIFFTTDNCIKSSVVFNSFCATNFWKNQFSLFDAIL